ncbi:MAG: pyridoxal-phosphate dependent enzyme [Desulfobacteraceae bacterium]
MALASATAGLDCFIYIPERYHTRRTQEMVEAGVRLIRIPGDYEAAVEASRERAEADEMYDANPGGANTTIQLKAYGEVAYEVYDELRDAPAAVAVPVSNGTTLAGVYKGFLSLYRRGKTSRIPRMVGGSSHGKNPIIRAFRKKTPRGGGAGARQDKRDLGERALDQLAFDRRGSCTGGDSEYRRLGLGCQRQGHAGLRPNA